MKNQNESFGFIENTETGRIWCSGSRIQMLQKRVGTPGEIFELRNHVTHVANIEQTANLCGKPESLYKTTEEIQVATSFHEYENS